MNGKIVDFAIARSGAAAGNVKAFDMLIDVVKEAMKEGWQPFGSVGFDGNGTQCFAYQAIVKYEETP